MPLPGSQKRILKYHLRPSHFWRLSTSTMPFGWSWNYGDGALYCLTAHLPKDASLETETKKGGIAAQFPNLAMLTSFRTGA